MLLTKLHIPSSGRNLVRRLGLFDKLNNGLNRKLILVSASAGFGKTTVVSDWINKNKIPAAWFSIDSNDNDIVNFFSYIISGIQSLKKGFGHSALSLLKSPTLPSPESIINLLINEVIGIKKDFILVFDDFHLINNQEIFKAVSYLLEYMPDNMHIAILSRSDPNLPIAKLRSQNQLVEIRTSDLSFSANDIATLFKKKLKTKLSADDIYSLESKTEGWIAGLQLAALSMQGYEDASVFIGAFAGNNRYIMDYLIEEVLKTQSVDTTDFLLKTSILDQFSAPLCNILLNRTDSQVMLEKLESNNMFVFPLDPERHWYRYHHLFADLLKQRLLLSDKSAVEKLHDRACEWYEENKMYHLALEHALEINNYEKSIQLLGEVVEEMWENGQHAAITKYGDMLPDELIQKNPEFCLYYSWVLISAGKAQKAQPFLTSAEKMTVRIIKNENSSKTDIQYNKKLLGKISVAFAYMLSHKEHSNQVFDYCKTAMENLSADDPLWFSWAWFSYGVSYFSSGDLLKGNQAFNKAFEYGKKSGNIYLISTIVIRMAENEQQLGHYKSAYRKCSELLNLIKEKGYSQITKIDWTYAALYFIMGITEFIWAKPEKGIGNIKTAYELSKKGKDVYQRVFILMAYSSILREVGDSEADKIWNELEEIIKQHEIPPFLMSFYIGAKIYICIEKKQLDKAESILSQYGLGLDKKKTHTNEAAYSSYVRVLFLQGKLDEAESLISELHALVSEGNKIERKIDLDILFALLYNIKGEKSKAISYMLEAMELASDENLIAYFIYNFAQNEDLYNEVFKIQATTKTKIPNKFITNLKRALEEKAKFRKVNANIALSAREIDTLKLIAEELSNQEIADRLFISLNTVKTHLKNIYLKLEVDSRTKAVAKAKEAGLV